MNKILNKIIGLRTTQVINVIVNVFEERLQKRKMHSYPQVIAVVLTKKCNLKCIYCKDYETVGSQQISSENYTKLAENLFPKARLIRFCSGGEPYLHKNLVDFLRIARRYNVKTLVMSNGMLIKEDVIRTIVREELITTHGFSIDGIKASTVEAIRINAKLDVVLKNVQMLIRIREEEKKIQPAIKIRYTLMRSNIEELPGAVRYWGEMGVDGIECSYISLCNNIDQKESLYYHQKLLEDIFMESNKIAKEYPRLNLALPPPDS